MKPIIAIAVAVLLIAAPLNILSHLGTRWEFGRYFMLRPMIAGGRFADGSEVDPVTLAIADCHEEVMLCTLAGLACLFLKLRHKPRYLKQATDPLNTPLFQWSSGEHFVVRDLLNGGVAVFGRSGSGKTSGSGKLLAESVVGLPGSGGLILAAKVEDADMWRGIFAKCGRSDDLIVFNPTGELRFNLLDYVRRLGGDTREITKALMTISETLRASDSKGGENADFWEAEQSRLLYSAIELVKAGTGSVTAPDIQRFIASAAYSPEHLTSDAWKAEFHNQTIKAGYQKEKSGVAQHDFDLAMSYWLQEFPKMSDKTRSSIQTGVMGLLHTSNTGVCRQLCSTTTNVSPDEMLQRRWVLINMPPSHYGDSGNFVNAGWKYLTQKMVLRRQAKPNDPVNCIWMDEAQNFLTTFDSHYLAECRSHKGCMVALTQSLHSVFSKLSGDKGYHQAMTLFANLHHKIFHSLGSAQDAEFASKLLGRELRTKIGGSMPPDEDMFSAILGRSKFSANFSEQYEAVVEPGVFMNKMRTGGQSNNYLVDGIVVRSGDPFLDGQNWKWVTFSQK